MRAEIEARVSEAVSCAPSLVILDDLDSIAGAHEGPEAGDAAEGAMALAECLADTVDACQGMGRMPLADFGAICRWSQPYFDLLCLREQYGRTLWIFENVLLSREGGVHVFYATSSAVV
jgi:hypothetical protein